MNDQNLWKFWTGKKTEFALKNIGDNAGVCLYGFVAPAIIFAKRLVRDRRKAAAQRAFRLTNVSR